MFWLGSTRGRYGRRCWHSEALERMPLALRPLPRLAFGKNAHAWCIRASRWYVGHRRLRLAEQYKTFKVIPNKNTIRPRFMLRLFQFVHSPWSKRYGTRNYNVWKSKRDTTEILVSRGEIVYFYNNFVQSAEKVQTQMA